MKKTESYRALFKLAEKDSSQAEEIANLIPGNALDLKILLRYQRYDNTRAVRSLSSDLAKRIPKEKLNLRFLIESQRSKYEFLRNLARDLALSIPTAKLDYVILVEYLKPENEYVERLVNKLAARYVLMLKNKM